MHFLPGAEVASQPDGDEPPHHIDVVLSKNLFQAISPTLRQLVTRQKTTRVLPGNGTTLSTLIDPDQNPQMELIRRPQGLTPCVVMRIKKEQTEIRHTPYPWGPWVQAFSPQPYYLTEEDLCSV
jgi:hypothetical protein